MCFDKIYLCLSIVWVFLLLLLLLFFVFFPCIIGIGLVYIILKKNDHGFDKCENISVVHI